MAYKKQEIIDMCLKVIEDECIFKVSELVAYVPISRPTFYHWNLHKLDSIKDAILDSKVQGKNHLRKKWMNSENATTDIVLYRLLADDDEIEKLNSNYTPKSSDTKTHKYRITVED